MLLTLLILLSSSTSAFAEENCFSTSSIINRNFERVLEAIKDRSEDEDRRTKKRRDMDPAIFKKILTIQTDYKAPQLGRENYFGMLYFDKEHPEILSYRNEINADEDYHKERLLPYPEWASPLRSAAIKDVEKGKLGVKLKSKTSDGFSFTHGGTIELTVKLPGQSAIDLTFFLEAKAVKKGNQPDDETLIEHQLFVVTKGGKKIPFDTLSVKIEKNIFHLPLKVDELKFTDKDTKVTYTVTPR